ncbi:MAG: Hsp70 family protein [Bacillota bacterium]
MEVLYALLDYLVAWGERVHGVNLRLDPDAMEKLSQAAERALSNLSEAESTIISLPFLSAGLDGPVHFEVTVTRKKLEEIAAPRRGV